MIRIGIDVGGANTDAAIMEDDRVVLSFKATTSTDVTTGVIEGLTRVIEKSGVDPKSIDVVALGTTHFINAVVQRHDLTPAAAVRLGLPATQAPPPNGTTESGRNAAELVGAHYPCATSSLSSFGGLARIASARAHAAPTRAASPPRHPISERPVGIPEALPAGMLT
jgi:hypothetical protein